MSLDKGTTFNNNSDKHPDFKELMESGPKGAGLTDRLAAYKIEGPIIIILFLAFIFSIYLISENFLTGGYLKFKIYLLFFPFLFLYFTIFEYFGATPGKRVMNLRVIDKSGERITFKQSLIRNLERLIWLIPFLGQLIAYISSKNIEDSGRRWGDEWAGTLVKKTKGRKLYLDR